MTRTLADRIADVRRLQEAARILVVEKRAALVPAIVESTGLTAPGVDLALAHHVELDATDAELTKLVARAGHVSRVAVVLSANVFVGALRAIALARAASTDVVVRPSRRDPAFARALVEAGCAVGDTSLRLDEALDLSSVVDGEIHVYGRDDTIAAVRSTARVPVRGHGSGMGVAWISARANLAEAARGLADDVIVFDQRGCLSPRIALVHGEDTRASEFAEALHSELSRLEASVPRGLVPPESRAAVGHYVATMTYAHRALVGTAHAIGVAPQGAPLALPPPYRHVHVAACASLEDAVKALAPLTNGVVIVGSDEIASARLLAPSWARVSALGHMQRPPLDGPVDLREG